MKKVPNEHVEEDTVLNVNKIEELHNYAKRVEEERKNIPTENIVTE